MKLKAKVLVLLVKARIGRHRHRRNNKPVNTAPPVISGEAVVGDTLTVSEGNWE